jgi:hypothetical protein
VGPGQEKLSGPDREAGGERVGEHETRPVRGVATDATWERVSTAMG